MIRIIAGKHKGRIIPTIKNASYRPSTSRLKEAIFSMLDSGSLSIDLKVSKVLDIFAGTGSLSFEALSRGATCALLIDINQDFLKAARDFASKIGEEANTKFLCTNAEFLGKAQDSYDIAFLDAPYSKGLTSKALKALVSGGWLSSGAIIMVEVEKKEDIVMPKGMDFVKEKKYGNSKLIILKYER